MEDIIEKIIEIEEKAQDVIRDAREADEGLDERIKADSIKLRDDIEQKIQAKHLSIQNVEKEGADEKIEKINEQTEKTMSALEEKYAENKDKWVEQIAAAIIGR